MQLKKLFASVALLAMNRAFVHATPPTPPTPPDPTECVSCHYNTEWECTPTTITYSSMTVYQDGPTWTSSFITGEVTSTDCASTEVTKCFEDSCNDDPLITDYEPHTSEWCQYELTSISIGTTRYPYDCRFVIRHHAECSTSTLTLYDYSTKSVCSDITTS